MAQFAFADSFFAFVVKVAVRVGPSDLTIPPIIVLAGQPFPNAFNCSFHLVITLFEFIAVVLLPYHIALMQATPQKITNALIIMLTIIPVVMIYFSFVVPFCTLIIPQGVEFVNPYFLHFIKKCVLLAIAYNLLVNAVGYSLITASLVHSVHLLNGCRIASD